MLAVAPGRHLPPELSEAQNAVANAKLCGQHHERQTEIMSTMFMDVAAGCR